MKLYLMRHGETVAKEMDPAQPLSNKGIASPANGAALGSGISFDSG